MKISELIRKTDLVSSTASPGLEVGGVQCDSRRIRPGDLFVAVPGTREDGTRFADAALSKGAAAVVAQSPAPAGTANWIQVHDARRILANLACALHGHPSRRLAAHGITGTNGKTTTCWLARDLLRAGGHNPGLISTVQSEYGGREIKSSRTTPDACELQSLLASMLASGCDCVTLEVSSHAIDQHRVGGMRFASVAFTNLTRDHLDYHRDMETYFRAKERLFIAVSEETPNAPAILNIDDPYGRRLTGSLPARGVGVTTYGFDPSAEVCATDLRLAADGTRFNLITPAGRAPIHSRLLGRYNVSNQLCAIAIACRAGVPFDRIVGTIEQSLPRWGRLEPVATALPAAVFVDYAHTDDALGNVLATLREITAGRLIVVFGCGGNRDRTKRPIMGRVASQLADWTVVTSDNPRNENPQAIIQEIVAGIPEGRRYVTVVDRQEAIATALRESRAGDVILIAGKGHETTQEFENRSIPFDDREQVRHLAGTLV
jgi:UDP-N-acetylmuramoyl-L-alanyl-D-glutamate--2,6-diaminopimelate ligase